MIVVERAYPRYGRGKFRKSVFSKSLPRVAFAKSKKVINFLTVLLRGL